MTRKSDQIDRIEETLARVEAAVGRLAVRLDGHGTEVMAEMRGARSAAEAAAGAVQGLAAVVSNPAREAGRAAPDAGTDKPASGRRATRTPEPGPA